MPAGKARDVSDRRSPVLKSQPPLLYPPYASTVLRAPERPLIKLPADYSDLSEPVYGHLPLRPSDHDLTRQVPGGEPQGERIIVAGRVVDEDGRVASM